MLGFLTTFLNEFELYRSTISFYAGLPLWVRLAVVLCLALIALCLSFYSVRWWWAPLPFAFVLALASFAADSSTGRE